MATETKQWKGMRWGYDEIIVSPFDDSSCEYCLTVPEVEAILAFTEFMTWDTRWESISGAEIDHSKVLHFANTLREKLMSGCCQDNTQIILHRINPETGIMELSLDGGTTWVTDPADPRISGTAQPPPVTSGVATNKCNAANSAVVGYSGMILKLIAQKDATASEAELSATIAATLTAIFGGAAPAAIVVVFGAIISFLIRSDAAAMSAAFTTETFDQILCALYCTIGSDGSFSDAQFSSLLTEINNKVTDAYAKTATYGLFKALGRMGINNWCALNYGGTADCSACDCGDCAPINVTVGVLIDHGFDEASGKCYVRVKSVDRGSHFGIEIAFNAAGTHPYTSGAKYAGYSLISGGITTVNLYRQNIGSDPTYYALSADDCLSYFDWEDYTDGTGSETVVDVFYVAC